MPALSLILVAVLLFGGCAWTPERDNPIDPVRDQPPQIADARLLFDYENHYPPVGKIRAFEVVCRIEDPDGAILPDSVYAVQTEETGSTVLGALDFGAERRIWMLHRTEYDLPGGGWDALQGDLITITASFRLGSVSSPTLQFQEPANEIYADVIEPQGLETVHTVHPTLRWRQPTDPVQSFSIEVFYLDVDMVWDTAGIAPTGSASDTAAVVVSRSLDLTVPDSDEFYRWTVTVTDMNGYRFTALPGQFYVGQ